MTIQFKKLDEKDLIDRVAEDIYCNKVVGWFQGASEFGPRALGHRSILANPTWDGVKDYLNDKIKYREYWRPYAPIVIEEHAHHLFDISDTQANSYMLLSSKVKYPDLLPGITHSDGTARIQTVNKNQNSRIYTLLEAFNGLTDVPVLLNTSFNLGGEPIVESPQDAMNTFKKSNIDILVMENFYIRKT